MHLLNSVPHPPSWVRNLSTYVPSWLVSLAILAAAALLALLFHRSVVRILRRLIGPERVFVQSLISRIYGALRFAFILAAVALVLPIVQLSFATSIRRHIQRGLAARRSASAIPSVTGLGFMPVAGE